MIQKKYVLNAIVRSFGSRTFHTTRPIAAAPLAGIRILDLTRIVAGPYCTMVLSDMGAEVIKIEKPGTGDEARLWGPPFVGDDPSKDSCYFQAFNRNKKSVCVNVQTTHGRTLLYDLAKISDVLVENYVPGKLDKLQLGYEDFKRVAPHLIYCSITGFGPEGPYSKRPGYDVIAASMGGLLHVTGPKDGEPCKVGVAMIDIATGLYAHGAIMAALLQRRSTSMGQKIDCNLLSTTLACLINLGSNYLNAGREASRWGTAHESIVPYQAFGTKDGGYYTLGTGSDAQFRQLCHLMNRDDLAANPNFTTNALRVQHRQEIVDIISTVMLSKSTKEWTELFADASFPNGPVNNLKAAFEDPHVQSLRIVQEVGGVKVVGPAVQFSEGGNEVRTAPPGLGQHTRQVLNEVLGYDQAKIEELEKLKVIQ